MISKTIIVSPSGNFYGSEQVLYDFLSFTKNKYLVFVPKNSSFYNKLITQDKHDIKGFDKLSLLYIKVLLLFTFKKYSSLYINEGGHIKYAKLAAKILKSKKIILHIRLLEDCKKERLGSIPPNLRLVSISAFISSHLKSYNHIQIYDPISTKRDVPLSNNEIKTRPTIGIIGRVSQTKGISNYQRLFKFLEAQDQMDSFIFKFYGDIVLEESSTFNFYNQYNSDKYPSILFEGFVSDQDSMYDELDVVLHLNDNEPLGRIGLESWCRGIPFISFNKGGTGEINTVLKLKRFLVEKESQWEKRLLKLLLSNLIEFTEIEKKEIKQRLVDLFGVERYVRELEMEF